MAWLNGSHCRQLRLEVATCATPMTYGAPVGTATEGPRGEAPSGSVMFRTLNRHRAAPLVLGQHACRPVARVFGAAATSCRALRVFCAG